MGRTAKRCVFGIFQEIAHAGVRTVVDDDSEGTFLGGVFCYNDYGTVERAIRKTGRGKQELAAKGDGEF